MTRFRLGRLWQSLASEMKQAILGGSCLALAIGLIFVLALDGILFEQSVSKPIKSQDESNTLVVIQAELQQANNPANYTRLFLANVTTNNLHPDLVDISLQLFSNEQFDSQVYQINMAMVKVETPSKYPNIWMMKALWVDLPSSDHKCAILFPGSLGGTPVESHYKCTLRRKYYCRSENDDESSILTINKLEIELDRVATDLNWQRPAYNCKPFE